MSELKTLKDLDFISHIRGSGLVSPERVIKELKQEAIKWIKSRIEFCNRCVWDIKSGETKMKFLYCREHKFWIDRFNITEEDLKNV